MHQLSNSQKQQLLASPHVVKITNCHVVYTPAFKVRAVELSQSGLSADEVFTGMGINPSFFPKDYCRYCIKRWRKKHQEQGASSLKRDSRGIGSAGRKPKQDSLDSMTVAELKSIILFQEDLIEAIKKKRALVKKS
ncbi:MAG: hypothetical protein EOP04_17465 [Proteobacteria bacterium]|nr:MAG: hypothetical protein EOP04_17465 [Pseudomonadota bacterium]